MNKPFDKGWDHLVERVNSVLEVLPFAKVESLGYRHGMLSVNFTPLDNPTEQFILNSISYCLERESVKVCELCGATNSIAIRKSLTPRKILCLRCYAFTLSDLSEKEEKENMFWTKEDLDQLAPIIAQIFGEQGRWLNTKPEFMRLAVNSAKFGKLWYGDVESLDSLISQCSSLKENEFFQQDVITITSDLNGRELASV